MVKVRRNFSFDNRDDAELLRWLDQQDNASATVRAALRAYRGERVTLADVHREVKSLRRDLQAMDFHAQDSDEEEDPDLASALDNLGL
jgi:hypothetical protein